MVDGAFEIFHYENTEWLDTWHNITWKQQYMYPDLGMQTKSLKIAICPIFHSPGSVGASNQDKVIYVKFGALGNNRSFVWIIKRRWYMQSLVN